MEIWFYISYVSGFGSSFSYLIRVWSVLWSLVEVFIGFAWQEPETGGSRSQSVGAGLNDLSWSRNLHLESKNLNDEPAENNPEIFTPGGLPLPLPHYDTSKRHAKETNKMTKTQLLSRVSLWKRRGTFLWCNCIVWPSGLCAQVGTFLPHLSDHIFLP